MSGIKNDPEVPRGVAQGVAASIVGTVEQA
jgi:hypothetical protein